MLAAAEVLRQSGGMCRKPILDVGLVGWNEMRESKPTLFRGRHFRSEIIVMCVRWYLLYPLSYRDLEEMMAERGLTVDHSTIARWVLYYAPILNQRIRREMRPPNRSWRVDELTCEWRANGPIYTAPLIRPGIPSSSCCRRTGI
jgi:hypothetical protein